MSALKDKLNKAMQTIEQLQIEIIKYQQENRRLKKRVEGLIMVLDGPRRPEGCDCGAVSAMDCPVHGGKH